jgi:hypothetical protein
MLIFPNQLSETFEKLRVLMVLLREVDCAKTFLAGYIYVYINISVNFVV